MTYNVFGGTWNLAPSINPDASTIWLGNWIVHPVSFRKVY